MIQDQARGDTHSPYQELLKKKKRFLTVICLTFLTIYFLLPLLIVFLPERMNRELYGSITITWAYAICQCLLTLLLASLYIWKARQFDRLVQEIVDRAESGDKT